MVNREIAAIFMEIADLLDLDGEKFKPEAYRRVARTLEQLPEDVSVLARDHRLTEIPGVGDALAKKVAEFIATGQVHYLEKLRGMHPPGLLAIMRLEGVGPKTTRRFNAELGIENVDDLRKALEDGRLDGLRGFGPKKIEMLRKAIGAMGGNRRLTLPVAQSEAEAVMDALKKAGVPFDRLSYAGSLRRRKETVGDIDIISTSSDPPRVTEAFVHIPQVGEVKLHGDTKATIITTSQVQVDLRVVSPEAFGAALQYFTGSKDHNVRVRTIAQQKGIKVNEYGVTREETLLPTFTEEDVYAAVGLQYIPPEIRENNGEIEAALEGKLPRLLAPGDVKGELHIHVNPDVTVDDLKPWAKALREAGLSYGGFVIPTDGSKRMDWQGIRDRLPRKIENVGILVGAELALESGVTVSEVPLGADFEILRLATKPTSEPDSLLALLKTRADDGPRIIIGHLDNLCGTEGNSQASSVVLSLTELASTIGDAKEKLSLEVAVTRDRVALESNLVRQAVDHGLSLVVSACPETSEDLARIGLASGIAARGWARAEGVLNAHDAVFWQGGR
jgi:DNA polymerase (family 10)